MEELIKKQKQEKKELQVSIQKMKQIVPKNDKKRRKEMSQKVAEMEFELKERHDNEVKKLDQSSEEKEKPILEKLEQLQIELENNQMNFESNQQSQKASKAQKRRERKEFEQQKRDKFMSEDENDSVNHIRNIEINKLNKLLKDHNLQIYDIPSDGDCMYKAIEHQLSLCDATNYSVDELRKLAADTLRKNKSDYLPFLTSSEENELMNDQEFENYCLEVEQTKKWGGNVELQVLSTSMKISISVYQADAPIIKLNCQNYVISLPLLLSYHKYLYQLGGHYNSLLKAS